MYKMTRRGVESGPTGSLEKGHIEEVVKPLVWLCVQNA
jgi:hypothetical protein